MFDLVLSDRFQAWLSVLNIFFMLLIGFWQIRLSKRMEKSDIKQSERDLDNYNNFIKSEAIRFIQAHSGPGNLSEIYLLPLCVVAYAYKPEFQYNRAIYRDFCCLTEDIQNEILLRCGISVRSRQIVDFYENAVDVISCVISDSYNDSENLFHDCGKYFEDALLKYGSLEEPELFGTCKVDSNNWALKAFSASGVRHNVSYRLHVEDLMRYHKNENPIKTIIDEIFNLCGTDDKDNTYEVLRSYVLYGGRVCC